MSKVFLFLKNIFQFIISFFYKKVCFLLEYVNLYDPNKIAAPAVGDIIEYIDEETGIVKRKVIAVVEFKNLIWDIRYFEDAAEVIGKRGEKFSCVRISRETEFWPPSYNETIVYRDGRQIFPNVLFKWK